MVDPNLRGVLKMVARLADEAAGRDDVDPLWTLRTIQQRVNEAIANSDGANDGV